MEYLMENLLNQDNLLKADFEQFANDIYFAKHLRFKKYFDDSILEQFWKIQELANKKIGELAVERKWLTPNIVEELYDEGIRNNKYFGQLAIEKNLLTIEQVKEIIQEQRDKFVSIGELAVNFGLIRPEKLEEEYQLFKQNQESVQKLIEEKLSKIPIPHLKLILNTIILTLTRMLLMPPRLTTMIQPVEIIYPMDKLYLLSLNSNSFAINLYFNFDEKFVNQIFIYKFKQYKNKKLIKLRNSIPQEIANILTGVILKNLSNATNTDIYMSVPKQIINEHYDLQGQGEHYKFAIASAIGKIEIVIQAPKK